MAKLNIIPAVFLPLLLCLFMQGDENERKKVNHEIRKKNDNDYDALSKQIELFRTKRSSNNNNNQEESERIQKIKQEMLMSIEGTKTPNENVNEKK